MSATNRGSIRSENDFYRTPSWCVRRLLEVVDLPGGLWYDPAVGSGALIDAVNEVRDDLEWTTADIDSKWPADYHGDATCYWPDRKVNVVFMNPPFQEAERFVRNAVFRADHVVAILRLGWLAGHKRNVWIRSRTPDVYVIPNRPSFNGLGTDSCDYAWFHWRRVGEPYGVIEVLKSTPVKERRLG